MWQKIRPASQQLVEKVATWSRRPAGKRVINFARHYSAQLGFATMVIVFLMITVGEGQAYDVGGTIKLASSLQNANQNNGFFGKPQVLSDQTVTTGEVQQQVAIIYQVAAGDTYSSIADRYNVHVASILDANHITAANANNLAADTQLLIPANDTNTSTDYLVALNAAIAQQQQQAAAQYQAQLAATAKKKVGKIASTPSGTVINGVVYVGTQWGAYNGGDPGQCTWYVNSIRHFPGPMGNGGAYLASARSYGLATGYVPRVGAVIVTAESYYGHVGIVIGVSGDNVTIREMNYLGAGKIDDRSLSASSGIIKGYIY